MKLRDFLTGLRRFAWAGVLLWLLVTIGAVAGYARTPPVYVATQQLDVALVPIGQLTATDQERLDAQASSVARTIASQGFLASQPFTAAVRLQLAGLSGAHAIVGVTPEQVGAALSATHTGTTVTLSARASSPTQAERLAGGATQALAQDAGELLPVPKSATVRVIPDQSPPHAMRDAAADDAARNLLLARLALAAATAVLLVMVLAWLGNRALG